MHMLRQTCTPVPRGNARLLSPPPIFMRNTKKNRFLTQKKCPHNHASPDGGAANTHLQTYWGVVSRTGKLGNLMLTLSTLEPEDLRNFQTKTNKKAKRRAGVHVQSVQRERLSQEPAIVWTTWLHAQRLNDPRLQRTKGSHFDHFQTQNRSQCSDPLPHGGTSKCIGG